MLWASTVGVQRSRCDVLDNELLRTQRTPMLLRLLSATLLSAALGLVIAQPFEEEGVIAHDTVHFGIVVSDIEAAAKFYGEVLGFQEVQGFRVPAELCTAAGLTDKQPLAVRVFMVDPKNDDATHVKLMQVPGVESKRSDNTFIHSQLGISYLTVGVRDITASTQRVREAGGQALAQGPVRLGERPDSDYLVLVRDPDGNLIELIGPKK